jgi:hypothetical protein
MQWIRNKDGRICGVWLWRWKIIVLPRGRDHNLWRICDCCGANEALIFCQTHAKYVCAGCMEWHGRRSHGGEFVLGYACRVISMSWAQMAVIATIGEFADHDPAQGAAIDHSIATGKGLFAEPMRRGTLIDDLTSTVAKAERFR